MFFLGILIYKGLTARRLYKSFGVKGLKAGIFLTDSLSTACCRILLLEHSGDIVKLNTRFRIKSGLDAWIPAIRIRSISVFFRFAEEEAIQ
jgi:hypothetical protein